LLDQFWQPGRFREAGVRQNVGPGRIQMLGDGGR